MNRLDEMVKLARQQIRDIEAEERELKRAKARLQKTLELFNAGEPSANGHKPLSGRRYPFGKDADAMQNMRGLILASAPFESRFTAKQAYQWAPNYRETQVRSILADMAARGQLERVARGVYLRPQMTAANA